MNSFCNTVYVIVMLLRRRRAGETGKMKGRGARWEGEKRRRGLFSLPIVHCTLNIYIYIYIYIYFIVIAIFI